MLVLANGLRLAVLGAAIGIVAAVMAAPLVTNLLSGVSPTDLPTMDGPRASA